MKYSKIFKFQKFQNYKFFKNGFVLERRILGKNLSTFTTKRRRDVTRGEAAGEGEEKKERSHNWRAAQLSYMGTDLAYNNRMYSYVLHRLSRTNEILLTVSIAVQHVRHSGGQ